MNKIARIGSLLRQTYRLYTKDVLDKLTLLGYSDWRVSFIDILLFIDERKNPTSSEIKIAIGLSKQTTSNHLNVLEERGFIQREESSVDKRTHHIVLTSQGLKFKLALVQSIKEVEAKYLELIGAPELFRIENALENIFQKVSKEREREHDQNLHQNQNQVSFLDIF